VQTSVSPLRSSDRLCEFNPKHLAPPRTSGRTRASPSQRRPEKTSSWGESPARIITTPAFNRTAGRHPTQNPLPHPTRANHPRGAGTLPKSLPPNNPPPSSLGPGTWHTPTEICAKDPTGEDTPPASDVPVHGRSTGVEMRRGEPPFWFWVSPDRGSQIPGISRLPRSPGREIVRWCGCGTSPWRWTWHQGGGIPRGGLGVVCAQKGEEEDGEHRVVCGFCLFGAWNFVVFEMLVCEI